MKMREKIPHHSSLLFRFYFSVTLSTHITLHTSTVAQSTLVWNKNLHVRLCQTGSQTVQMNSKFIHVNEVNFNPPIHIGIWYTDNDIHFFRILLHIDVNILRDRLNVATASQFLHLVLPFFTPVQSCHC